MVACARLAASTIDVFTVSRLLSASASQSNSSSSRCRPSACILSLLSALLSLARNFAADFLNVGPCFWHCKEKMGWKAIFGGVAAASAPAPRALGAARGAGARRPRGHRIAPEGHFSVALFTTRGRAERTMGWNPVTKAATTSGSAEGTTELNAFDNALLAAGIGNINLVKVSSILPPDTEIVDLPRLRPGAIVPTAFAAITSEVPGEVVAAAVGWARPDDSTKNGVIMEFHDKATREEAERAIVHMLQESFKVRGWKMRDMQVCAVDHRVERTGCALAAVTLLSDDDVV